MARREPRFYLKIFIISLLFLVIIGYAYFRAHDFLVGPSVAIIEPKNGKSFDSPDIIVSGTAKNISFLTLNGLQIYTDESGAFNRKLLLSQGYNIITLVGKDKFGRETKKTIGLVYFSPNSQATTTNDETVSTSTKNL